MSIFYNRKWGAKMSDQNDFLQNNERDLLDGGFAVVDREKLIEEETREVTPLYKHFINVFIAPRKMMEENFYADPPKGTSVAIVGCLLFTTIYLILTFANPVQVEQVYDGFRMQGIAENMLKQKYMLTQVTGIIAGLISIFLGALVSAVGLQIFKVIAKDKCKFGALYVLTLLSIMASAGWMCVDRIIGYFIPTTTVVLGLPILFDAAELAKNLPLMTVVNLVTIPSIVSIVITIIGYSVLTHTSTKKATLVVMIYELLFTGIGLAIAMVVQSVLQNMQMAM